jgi:U3 small nucleolar RNA-associated protein 15
MASEYEPGQYQPIEVKRFPSAALRETAEGRFWRRFRAPIMAQQFGPVTHIDFSPVFPHNFAATASTRVSAHPTW